MALPPRIVKETQKLLAEPVSGIFVEPSEKNGRHFFVRMAGPEKTPYEGGLFELEVFLPNDYPMCPPKVLMKTKIYPPNLN